MSSCYGFVVYEFGFIWSKLGYAEVWGSLLAGKAVWLTSKWSYMDSCSPLFNVVSFGGKETVGVLKILRDPY